jgi:hypothetical protein
MEAEMHPPSANNRSASRSFRTTCSGVCLLRFIRATSCPRRGDRHPHNRRTDLRGVTSLRFDFESEPWTLEAIGNELDLTRERIRQLEHQALARLRALRDLISFAA